MFLGVESVLFDTVFTTDEALVRDGLNGSKWVYSDGSEVILTEPISAIELYDNEVVEIDPETEYTIYVHQVHAGIKGSKQVFSNGEERVITAPVAAVALYKNKVEEFDFTTVEVESSDLAFGESRVIQDGIIGRRVVFFDADGKVVDSLILSAPVSRIEQRGANKQTLVLTPFETTYTTDDSKVHTGQNGTRYIYSDGREETVTEAVTAVQLYRYADESVGYKQITNENPSLAVGKANVLVKGADGSNRVYYDLNGKVVETRRLTEAVDRVVEVGTLVVEDEVIIPELPKPDLDGDKTEEVKPGAESEKSEELNPAEPEDTGSDADGKDTEESDGKESGSDVDDNESNPKTPDKIDEDTTAIPEGSNDNPVTDQGPLEPINSGIPVNAASILPATGEKGQQIWLTVGAISLLAGFGLVIQGKHNKEEN
ncbi:G5 domain-containing protein [Fundicoccus sp. Sow4_F4]|uniref:G5 domain-containing protein n=1 Tax=Fundicoccus sp. Sow4_F4 TaxID=3438783 RepID=UPI003F8F484E